MIISRQDPNTLGWLAPRMAFDVVIECVAEQSVLQQQRMQLGAGWYWDRLTHSLVRPAHWRTAEERGDIDVSLRGVVELSMVDRVALGFAQMLF